MQVLLVFEVENSILRSIPRKEESKSSFIFSKRMRIKDGEVDVEVHTDSLQVEYSVHEVQQDDAYKLLELSVGLWLR